MAHVHLPSKRNTPTVLKSSAISMMALFFCFALSTTAKGTPYLTNGMIVATSNQYLDGQVAGQCKQFVNQVVHQASRGEVSVAGGYHDAFNRAGGIEVSSSAARPGDIIQVTPAGSTDQNAESLHDIGRKDRQLHTAIVLTNKGGGVFRVVQSNTSDSPYRVSRVDWNPYVSAEGSIIKIWRIGKLSGGGDFTPGVAYKSGSNYRFDLRNSNSNGYANISFTYGNPASHYKVVSGDWNGDGKTTVGVISKSGGNLRWLLRNANSGGVADLTFDYGNTNDIPIVGDWNGDGSVTVGVIRKSGSNWRWLLRDHNSSGYAQYDFVYGNTSTTPVSGDWDGDGIWTPGVISKSGNNLRWLLRNKLGPGSHEISVKYGRYGDTPIGGDWDNDGIHTVGVVTVNGNNLRWKLRNSLTDGPAEISFDYGRGSHHPIVGNWDSN